MRVEQYLLGHMFRVRNLVNTTTTPTTATVAPTQVRVEQYLFLFLKFISCAEQPNCGAASTPDHTWKTHTCGCLLRCVIPTVEYDHTISVDGL